MIDAVENTESLVFGDQSRVHIAASASVLCAYFNVNSGHVYIGEQVSCAHFARFLTGWHDYRYRGAQRNRRIADEGHDIVVEDGVWIGTGATIVGPAVIGKDSVIAAGAVVRGDVPPGVIVAGNPARIVHTIDFVDEVTA